MLSWAIAMIACALVLIGYFVPDLQIISTPMITWAIILAGFALLVGVANLLGAHWSKIIQRKRGAVYSIVLIVAFVLTLVVGMINGPSGKGTLWIFENIQLPVEISLLAVLAITLAYASMRLLRRRVNAFSVLFVVTVLIILLGAAPLYMIGNIKSLSTLSAWIANVPALAGARGILLGVALGVIATGLRILMGTDRPYRG